MGGRVGGDAGGRWEGVHGRAGSVRVGEAGGGGEGGWWCRAARRRCGADADAQRAVLGPAASPRRALVLAVELEADAARALAAVLVEVARRCRAVGEAALDLDGPAAQAAVDRDAGASQRCTRRPGSARERVDSTTHAILFGGLNARPLRVVRGAGGGGRSSSSCSGALDLAVEGAGASSSMAGLFGGRRDSEGGAGRGRGRAAHCWAGGWSGRCTAGARHGGSAWAARGEILRERGARCPGRSADESTVSRLSALLHRGVALCATCTALDEGRSMKK